MNHDQQSNKPFHNLQQYFDLEMALQAAGLGVWELDPRTNLISWDDRCRALFGLATDHRLPYQQAIRCIHPQDVDRVNQAVSWAMNPASDGIYDQTYRTIGADDGQLRWVRFFGRGYFTPEGKLIRFAGAAQEITQIVLAQQTIQEKEARFRSLVEESPMATCLYLGPDLVVELANEAMIRFFGQGPTLVGQPIRQVLTGSAADQAAIALLEQAWTTGAVYTANAAPAHLTIEGRQVLYYFDFTLKPLRNAAGAVYAILQTAVDVTQRELAQQQRQQLEARQHLLLTLSDQLRSLTDAAQMEYQAATLLGAYLGASRVGFAEDLQDGQTIVVTQNYLDRVPSLEGRYQYNDYGPELLASFRVGQRVVRSDIQNDPTLTTDEKQAHAALQLGATLNIPLLKKNQLVLVLFVHFQQAHHWTDQELEVCGEVAERTWLAIERARAEAALRQSEANYRTLFESMQEGYTVCEAIRDQTGTMINYRFLQVNPIFEKLTGLGPAQTVGRTAWEILPGLDPKWFALYQHVIDTQEPIKREDFIPPLNQWYVVRAFYFGPERFAVLFDEITERKQAEASLRESEDKYRQLTIELEKRVQTRTQELLQANRDLLRSNENLQQFAYVASHDLQEPLRKVQSFSTLLLERLGSQPDELAVDYLQRMASAGARMSTLIKDLLSYSRIATRQQAFGRVSLQAILSNVLETLDWDIDQTGSRIEVDALPVVSGDESQLSQLFQNLLTNAMKFVQPGQVPQVHIQYKRLSQADLPGEIRPSVSVPFYHQISVRDEGIGFDSKYVERIFQVFQRLHSRNDYGGSGVGLAICQRVVENHGGAITASSQPGQGTTFWVYLPV